MLFYEEETAVATCNNGAYTFADYEDIEAQLLKPGKFDGDTSWIPFTK